MIKFLFLDYRELEIMRGFGRELEPAQKHPQNPLLIADKPWEGGNFTLYGSVVKAPGKPFQLWYTVIHKPWKMYLAYAESDDGITWRRPLFDIIKHRGRRTNLVFGEDVHGAAIWYDAAEPDESWRYKMLAGTAPSGCISAYRSADGIHWQAVRRFPVIVTNPDCPMGFLRAPDGRYVAYHRLFGLGRRVCRSETWDFRFWPGEPRMVLEPGPEDPPQIQFYGMGSAPYGTYEIGTLWIYHTDPSDPGPGKMRGYQETEFTYARSGYAWHRAAPGVPFIPHGRKGSWEQGNLQCASAPVFLEDEIRYYYAGTTMFHQSHWELEPQRAGLGMASIKPDRWIALSAEDGAAELTTCSFALPSTDLRVNASTMKDGWVRLALLDPEFKPIKGFTEKECLPIVGDSTAHRVRWAGDALPDLTGTRVRIRLRAKRAKLYSIFVVEPGETPLYHRFRAVRP